MGDSIFINQSTGGGGFPPEWRHKGIYPAGETMPKYAAIELRQDAGAFPYELTFEPEIPEGVKASLQSPTGMYWIITLAEEPYYRLYKAQDEHAYVEVEDAPVLLEAVPTAVHFNTTGSILYLKDGTLKAYQMLADEIIEMPMEGLTALYSVVSDFSNDGKRYATLTSNSSSNGTSKYYYMYLNLYQWDDESGKYVQTITSKSVGNASHSTSISNYGGGSGATKLQFAKDGSLLFTGFSLYTYYRNTSMTPVMTTYTYMTGHYVYQISSEGTIAGTVLTGATGSANGAFSPDERYLAVKITSSSAGAKVYEVLEDNTLSLVGQCPAASGVVAFSRDGKRLIESASKTISVYSFDPQGTIDLITSYTNDKTTTYVGAFHPFDSNVVIRRNGALMIEDAVSIFGVPYIGRFAGSESAIGVLGMGMLLQDVNEGEAARVNLFDPIGKVLYG